MEAALAGTPYLVPRALCCDLHSGRVEFEYLANTSLLQEMMEEAYETHRFHRVLKLNDAAAELLATLHQRLVLSRAREWHAPAFLVQRIARGGVVLLDADNVFLHCDFSPVNLLVNGDDRIGVIDASPNTYFTDYACLRGHRVVDIATYTAKLFWPFRLRSYSTVWRRFAVTLRRRFVSRYERSSGHAIDRGLLSMFEFAVVRRFAEWKSKRRVVRWAASELGRAALAHRS